jgi:dTDP-4-amino-4,6-dideoxygalactose transaminase
VFNSFEGGAIICHDEITKKRIDALKNTGLDPNHKLIGYGFNAKMNEMQSAFGLLQLKYVDNFIACRKVATLKYRELLKDIKGIRMINDIESVDHNYSYFPVIIDAHEYGATRDELDDYLKNKNIFARKYFYPLVNDYKEFNIYKSSNLPIARKIAESVLCLPLFHDISFKDIEMIVDSVNKMHQHIS